MVPPSGTSRLVQSGPEEKGVGFMFLGNPRVLCLVVCLAVGFGTAAILEAEDFRDMFKDFDCSTIPARGIDKQENLRASLIRVYCGQEQAGGPETAGPGYEGFPIYVPEALGTTDVNLVTGAETSPHVTQSETFVWSEGTSVVTTFNDSRTAPSCYGGGAWSSDGGVTFTRLDPSPFCSGHGTNFGDPTVVYNQNLDKWYASFLATGCGGQGIGVWESTNGGMTWSTGACAHSGTSDDRQSHWVDNNPVTSTGSANPYYGRMYISWNDFASLQRIFVTHSDNGTTWSTPVALTTGFTRNVQLTGGPDGTVFVAAMDEGGGGSNNRANLIYRSTNGGDNWTGFSMGPAFPPVGDLNCTAYFRAVAPIWRHMGWGQPGVGPNSVVHYAYAADGPGADTGDILYVRSTDNGASWSTPITLNTDASGRTQWMPSLAVSPNGSVFVGWYDRRNTANNDYERFGRVSPDNGVSWLPDEAVSDVIIPQPAQLDPNVQACYAGDYDYHSASTVKAHGAWTDGRNQVASPAGGSNQQDAYYDQILFQQGFTLQSTPASQSVCAPAVAVYTLDLAALPGYSGTQVTLGASGHPAGSTATFNTNPVTLDGSSMLTIGNTGSAAPGSYSIDVTGTGNDAGSTANTIPLALSLFDSAPGATTLSSPADGAIDRPTVLTFMWTAASGAQTYHLEVDDSADFSSPVIDAAGIAGTSYTNSGAPLLPATDYYWRVTADNVCGSGATSSEFSFTTVGAYIATDDLPFEFIGGITDIGSNCDDCLVNIALPFTYNFYGAPFTSVNASSNGNLQFSSSDNEWNNVCLPFADFNNGIFLFWDDLRTDGTADGIYTATVGSAPYRTFVIEYRSINLFAGGGTPAGTWEVLLYEHLPKITVNYLTMVDNGGSATTGVQQGTGGQSSQYSCNSAVLTSSKRVDYLYYTGPPRIAIGTGSGAGAGNDLVRLIK